MENSYAVLSRHGGNNKNNNGTYKRRRRRMAILIGGDFNARTGNRGGPIGEEEEEERKESRKSKDKVINKEGYTLINKIEERGWAILNGSFGKKGEYTYIGDIGSSVIDYVVGNDKAGGEVKTVTEGIRTESDHVLLEIELEGIQVKEEEKKKKKVEIERSDWTEGVKRYHEKCEGWTSTKNEIEDIWKEMKEKVKNAMTKHKKKIIPWRMGRKEWYNKEWKGRKRKLRKLLRNWKKELISKEEFVKKRKEYKKWCKEKRKKYEEEEEEKIRKIKTEAEAWKLINKFKKRKTEETSEEIQMEEWRDHFMEILDGTKERVVLNIEEEEEEEDDTKKETAREIKEISREELIETLKKLKKGKATGEDGIENEAWRYMQKDIREEFLKLINKIWKGEGIPEDWNKGVISPIYKRGEKNDPRNYRGVTLMNTAYKIYTSILNARLGKEIENKLREVQFGFRKKRGTMDAIYVANYVINKELSKKKGKIYALFADLKAAFDRIDRRKLNEIMKKREIEDNLRRRIMEIYKETRNVVKIKNKRTDEFWTEKGVRQGCPLSPTLFNIYIMDLEGEMERGQAGGIVIGKEKFWTLLYADDVVMMARTETELKEMMKRFKKYLEKKGLSLSSEKSKVMVFEKGRGRMKKREWKWGEEDIEEVKEMRYLGYLLQKNGGAEKHIKERIRRATIAMKRTWSIGERLFKEDFGRRMKMFEALVESVALYGAEIWGWQQENRLDKIKRKYIKWILGLDGGTPNYLLTEEVKMKETKVRSIKRAVKYEEKARKSEKKMVQE